MLCAWFFDGFRRQATISCYMCVFGSFVFLMLCAWFFDGLAGRPPLVAICVFLFFVFLMLCAWFFDWFRRQATISCYMCVFVGFCVFDAMCIVFLLVLADRPPFVY